MHPPTSINIIEEGSGMLEAEGWVGFGRVVTEVRVTVLPFIVGGALGSVVEWVEPT